jgi:phage baseplate assembly protein W
MNVAHPYRFDTRGRTAESNDDDHIREMIEQLLFTTPNERVNRPTFGSGLLRLVFAPNSPELAAATQLLIQGALQQWLGEIIQIDAVDVASDDAVLRITIRYLTRRTQQTRVEQFTKDRP